MSDRASEHRAGRAPRTGRRGRRCFPVLALLTPAVAALPGVSSAEGASGLVATVEVPSLTASGGVATLALTITNVGTVPATGVTVASAACGSRSQGDEGLAPGTVWTITCPVTLPAIDDTTGAWTDTATVTATIDGSPASVTTTASLAPLTIRRDLALYWSPDESVPYSLADASTADVDVALGAATDRAAVGVAAPARWWARGGTVEVSETDLPTGYVPVTPSVTTTVDPSIGRAEVTLTDVITADLSLEITAPATARRGTTFGIIYTVRNDGPASVTPRLDDYRCADIRFITGDSDDSGRIDPSEIWTYRCIYRAAPRTNARVSSFAWVRDAAMRTTPVLGGDPDGTDDIAMWRVRSTR